MSCEIEEISKKILSHQKTIPEYLYHYGKKEILDLDIKERNVPKDAWDKFVMGGTSTWGLKGTRRGLYGTIGIDTNNFGGDSANWLMRIKVKPECREPGATADLSKITKDPRFKKWYAKKKHEIKLSEFDSKCHLAEADEEEMVKGYTDVRCETIMNDFLASAQIKVLHDYMVRRSFYLRDRSCIETIEGTPDEWFNILSTNIGLWKNRCGDSADDTLPGLLLQTMALSQLEVSPEVKDKLLQNIQANTGFDSANREILQAAVEASARCKSQKNEAFKKFVTSRLGSALELKDLTTSEFNSICPNK
jgi:hypothetical protein